MTSPTLVDSLSDTAFEDFVERVGRVEMLSLDNLILPVNGAEYFVTGSFPAILRARERTGSFVNPKANVNVLSGDMPVFDLLGKGNPYDLQETLKFFFDRGAQSFRYFIFPSQGLEGEVTERVSKGQQIDLGKRFANSYKHNPVFEVHLVRPDGFTNPLSPLRGGNSSCIKMDSPKQYLGITPTPGANLMFYNLERILPSLYQGQVEPLFKEFSELARKGHPSVVRL